MARGYRRSTRRYGKRKRTYRKRTTYKRKRAIGKRSSNVLSRQTPRYPAIQRGVFTTQTKLVEFVEDRTFYLLPNGDTTAGPPFAKRTTCGLNVCLTNPFDGCFNLGTNNNPFGGALDTADTAQQGGNTSPQPPGWARWLGYAGTHPYREGCIIGAKYEFRVEQLHRVVTAGSGVKTFAVMSWIDKEEGGIINTATITALQSKRGVAQANMTGIHDTQSMTAQTQPNAHQAGGRGTYSCKKFWGINDIKDNLYEKGGQYNAPGSHLAPTDNAYLHIAFCDRIEGANPAGYVLPGLLVRVKVKMMALLTQPNSAFNLPSGGAGAVADQMED